MTGYETHNGSGPFGPVRTFVPVVDGVKQLPVPFLRYLCTSPRDVEALYGSGQGRVAALARVQARMLRYTTRNPEVALV